MPDPTEARRRELVEKINGNPRERTDLESEFGKTWDTQELSKDFQVRNFLAPFVMVINRKTNQQGTLMFQHHPRYYFGWESDEAVDGWESKRESN